MHRLKHWMINKPVLAFFVLTYAISWPLFIIAIFLFPGNMAVQGIMGTVAAFGPVLAAIIISRISDTQTQQKQGSKRPAAFLLSWLFSIMIMVLFIWKVRGANIQVGLLVFSGILALLPAYVLSGAFSKKAGIQRYLGSIIKPRGNFVWYAVALLTFPVIQWVGYMVSRIVGQNPGELLRGGFSINTIIIIVLSFCNGFLYNGGINEESGWRGFAIPYLQKRYSPLAAAIIVWFFWVLWHLFHDISSGNSISSILFNRLFFNLLWAVLFVWVFNRTKGSILAPALFHPAMNTFGEFLPRTDAATFLFTALTLYVILSERMWIKLSGTNTITGGKPESDTQRINQRKNCK